MLSGTGWGYKKNITGNAKLPAPKQATLNPSGQARLVPDLDPAISPFQGLEHNSIFSLTDNFVLCPRTTADIYASLTIFICLNNEVRLS